MLCGLGSPKRRPGRTNKSDNKDDVHRCDGDQLYIVEVKRPVNLGIVVDCTEINDWKRDMKDQ